MYNQIMKNCIIVHGCPSTHESPKEYAGHWMPWLKTELDKKGISTQIALMPEPWSPNYSKYKKALSKYKVTKASILVGHSCGCSFLVRWLGETGIKIKKLILVAPWKIAPKNDNLKNLFYDFTINKNITQNVKEIVLFTSNNEQEEGKQSLLLFQEILKGKVITLENKGHYTLDDMKTDHFPELLNEILK